MKRILALLLGWAGVVSTAAAQDRQPPALPPMPDDLKEYFQAALEAERIADPLQRCLAYPDMPGNQWPENVVQVHCNRVARPRAITLDELERLLDQPDGAAVLETRLSALLEAHFDDPEQRDRIHEFYWQLEADERSGRLATRWLRAAPDSPFALAAMGIQRARQGWEARGTAWRGKTDAHQIHRMEQHFVAAVAPLHDALDRQPRLGPACVALTEIGRMSADALQQQALAHCMEVDPHSYYVVSEMMMSALPKWGGSLAAIDRVEAYARKHLDRTPTLRVMFARAQMERLVASDSRDPEAYLAATRIAPHADVHAQASRHTQGWTRVVQLSQTLRFWPEHRHSRHERYAAMLIAQLWDWAEIDLEWLARALPDNREYQFNHAWVLQTQRRFRESLPRLRAILAWPEPPPGVEELLCEALANVPETAGSEEAGECSAKLLARLPGLVAPWYWRANYLMAHDDRDALRSLLAELGTAKIDSPADDRTWLVAYIGEYLERAP